MYSNNSMCGVMMVNYLQKVFVKIWQLIKNLILMKMSVYIEQRAIIFYR